MNTNALVNFIMLIILCVGYLISTYFLNNKKSKNEKLKISFFNKIFMKSFGSKTFLILHIIAIVLYITSIIINLLWFLNIVVFSQLIIALNCVTLIMPILNLYIYLKNI